MTARADRLTKRANPADREGSGQSSDPAGTVRVFVDALERLDYRMDRLLADAGILRADLDDPDARIPCTVWVPMFCRALEERPMKNAGMRLATVTPIGAFPLIDYLIVTSRNVGEGLDRLARYLRIAEAPSIPSLQEGEDPIRVLFEGRDTPMSAEFSVTLNVLHFREETEDRFRAAYASFSHTPDDVAEMERVLGCPVHTGASWNGWALSRETWHLPLRRRDPVLGRLLQRRLAAAGFSYQQLLDLARRDAAERYLSDSTLSIGEVAYLLGYSEPAAFNRAFRRWHHETPHAFRQRERSERSRTHAS